ncbi:hypothetical protein R1sor_004084 [Riccia sorocarpa]|uniref:Uncharacterized protein n=1 Tax=Riccia sorocarpa TaxID=122646 RepID=A0ABD3H6B5_9MARC
MSPRSDEATYLRSVEEPALNGSELGGGTQYQSTVNSLHQQLHPGQAQMDNLQGEEGTQEGNDVQMQLETAENFTTFEEAERINMRPASSVDHEDNQRLSCASENMLNFAEGREKFRNRAGEEADRDKANSDPGPGESFTKKTGAKSQTDKAF